MDIEYRWIPFHTLTLELKTFILDGYWISISKSLYPLWPLLIFCLIPSSKYPCWIPTNKNFLNNCLQNSKFSRLLIGCSVSKISTLIDYILHFPGYLCMITFICRLLKREDQALISISTIRFSAKIRFNLPSPNTFQIEDKKCVLGIRKPCGIISSELKNVKSRGQKTFRDPWPIFVP